MNIQKQFSLAVVFFMTISLSFLLIGSMNLLQAETSQTVAESQVVIDKSGPTSVFKGEPITYMILITNTSPMTLTTLYVTDTLPVGASYITGTKPFSETLIDNNVLSWTIPSLAPDGRISLTFAVTATETITNSDYRVVSAEGISATGDSPVVTSIMSPLTITKKGPVTATIGAPITYTLYVTNKHSKRLTQVNITDALPVGATYITSTSLDTPVLLSGVLSWTIENLGGDKTEIFTFAVMATETITNSEYGVLSAEGSSATGQISVVTTIEDEEPKLYLPVILRQPTQKPTPTSTPTPTATSTPTPTATPKVILMPTPSCLMAEEEPNNGFSDADSRGPLCEDRDVQGDFSDEDKVDDIYVIQSASGHLTVRLSNIPAGTDYELELYRGTTRVAESRNDNNQDEEITYQGEAGRYYARVFRFEGSSSQPYSIRWQNGGQ